MIVRDEGPGFLLITQPDHARLAEEIVAALRTEPALDTSSRGAIRRVASMDPRAGALVAQHAVTVYGYRRDEAGWAGFFDTITAMRDGLLRRLGALEGAGRDRFDAEYRCIRLGDSLSLQFCNAWREPRETIGYRAAVRGSTLVISPDPFDGAAVPLQVIGRRIPARRVGSGDAGIDQRKRRRKHSFRTLNLLLPLFHFFTFPLRPTVP